MNNSVNNSRCDLSPADVLAAARRYKGAPWKHQGRTTAGIDCLGLIVAVARDLGICPADADMPNYRRRPDGKALTERLCRFCDRGALESGAIALYGDRSSTFPYHLGIIVTAARNQAARIIIHADGKEDQWCGRLGRVLEAPEPPGLTLRGLWRYRGVDYG